MDCCLLVVRKEKILGDVGFVFVFVVVAAVVVVGTGGLTSQ